MGPPASHRRRQSAGAAVRAVRASDRSRVAALARQPRHAGPRPDLPRRHGELVARPAARAHPVAARPRRIGGFRAQPDRLPAGPRPGRASLAAGRRDRTGRSRAHPGTARAGRDRLPAPPHGLQRRVHDHGCRDLLRDRSTGRLPGQRTRVSGAHDPGARARQLPLRHRAHGPGAALDLSRAAHRSAGALRRRPARRGPDHGSGDPRRRSPGLHGPDGARGRLSGGGLGRRAARSGGRCGHRSGRRNPEVLGRWCAGRFSHRQGRCGCRRGLRPGAFGGRGRHRPDGGVEGASRRGRRSDARPRCRAALRRRGVRQCRRGPSARLHGDRPRRERGLPHGGAVRRARTTPPPLVRVCGSVAAARR